jgi:thiol-disulfide isomerase/thioredoxin
MVVKAFPKRRIATWQIALMLILLAIGGFGAYKLGKRVINAYAAYDATTVRDRGEAGELQSTTWLNSTGSVSLASLRGQVVVIDFWRFECPQCIASQPYIKSVYERYQGKGLTLLSVHSPETNAEFDTQNVKAYVQQNDIKYPVAIDTDHTIFRAYTLHAWPTVIVVDKAGRIRYQHIGKGRYNDIEAVIKELLAEA